MADSITRYTNLGWQCLPELEIHLSRSPAFKVSMDQSAVILMGLLGMPLGVSLTVFNMLSVFWMISALVIVWWGGYFTGHSSEGPVLRAKLCTSMPCLYKCHFYEMQTINTEMVFNHESWSSYWVMNYILYNYIAYNYILYSINTVPHVKDEWMKVGFHSLNNAPQLIHSV